MSATTVEVGPLARAACRGIGPRSFFDFEHPSHAHAVIRLYCSHCPSAAKVACARLRRGADGVWGGRYFPPSKARLAETPVEVKPRPVLDETPRLRHGTRAMYVKGCGCEPCLEADRAYQADRRERARLGKARSRAALAAASEAKVKAAVR